MRLKLITAPATEPVSLADVQGQCRTGDLTAESATVNRYIAAIRGAAEKITRRSLITQTWELVLDTFPAAGRGEITIPRPPLQSVTSITYVDTAGATQTLDAGLYRVITEVSPTCDPGIVLPAYGESWPDTLDDLGVVRIRFVCGYGPIAPATTTNVPAGILQWILLNVANLYENRETETVASGKLTQIDLHTLADSLIDDFRVMTF